MSGKGFKKASAVTEESKAAPQSADFQIDVSMSETFIYIYIYTSWINFTNRYMNIKVRWKKKGYSS